MFTYQTVEEFDGPSLWVRIWSYFFSSAGSLEVSHTSLHNSRLVLTFFPVQTILALFIIYAWSHMGPTAPAQHTIRTQRRRRRASSLSDAVRPPQSVIEETESEVDEANEEFVDALECCKSPPFEQSEISYSPDSLLQSQYHHPPLNPPSPPSTVLLLRQLDVTWSQSRFHH